MLVCMRIQAALQQSLYVAMRGVGGDHHVLAVALLTDGDVCLHRARLAQALCVGDRLHLAVHISSA